MNQFVLPTAELLHSRGEAQTALHERAAQLTRSRFGQTVFVRAVVEISNFCRENCLYCGMRRSNRALKRFRAKHEQLADPGNGYRRGLRTGANLVTINLTPSELRGDYLLYKRDRFIMTEERILAAIAAEGLIPSSQSLADFYRAKKVNGKHVDHRQARTVMKPEASPRILVL